MTGTLTDRTIDTACYHCGETNTGTLIAYDNKTFCCAGCKSVYEILQEHNLCGYYTLTETPGVSQQRTHLNTFFDFLDDVSVQEKLIYFKDGNLRHVKFTLPNMHCSSCIWLLEHLYKMNAGVVSSTVNFLEKEIKLVFDAEKISLKELVILLKKVGYEPRLALDDLTGKPNKAVDRKQLYKIAIAGFCFGNIMMLSLPDYFAAGDFLNDGRLNTVFNYLTLVLSLPVFFYAAREFFVSSWQQLVLKKLNIDIPIALAILITFVVSVYRIVFEQQLGYMDTMAGIVFFMLLGRFFQNKSYHYLTFQRGYSSYLPIAVNVVAEGKETTKPLTSIGVGDTLVSRQQEVIPADSILMSEQAWFDYSFVTGESNWVEKHRHEPIYAGAILKSAVVHLTVSKKPSQSYITQLWNSRQQAKFQSNTLLTTERINVWFSAIVLLLGTLACLYWIWKGEASTGLRALVTVWIVACPCALLLCSTFTHGNMLTLLANYGIYIKNAAVMEVMQKADTLVFDKTGTLTDARKAHIDFVGRELSASEKQAVYSLAFLSIHPLSKLIAGYWHHGEAWAVSNYKSLDGQGVQGDVNGWSIRLGSAAWLGVADASANAFTKVFVSIQGDVVGYFEIKNEYRKGVLAAFKALNRSFDLHVLSGDNDAERQTLSAVVRNSECLNFNCLPEDKTAYVAQLQAQGKTVLMIGDGLNDMNAFEKSDVGLAVIDDEHNFLPACDVIVHAKRLVDMQAVLAFIQKSRIILFITFGVSILYNLIGLSYAIQGDLTPVVAAVLMPISTVSIVGLSFFLSRWYAKRYGILA
ncbi:MAG: heavy metal translocating P-type ATPase [Chitinophagaceae bacterium]